VSERGARRSAVRAGIASYTRDKTGGFAASCGFEGSEKIRAFFLRYPERFLGEFRVVRLFFLERGRFLSFETRRQRRHCLNSARYLPRQKGDYE
jgi:hypothetical protein